MSTRPFATRTLRGLALWEWLLLAVAVGLFVAQTYTVIPRESATFDEPYHLTAGYAYLRTGDFRLADNHPPLMGMLGGLGLLTKADVNLPLDDPAWQAGDRFRYADVFLWEQQHDRGPELLVAARRMMVILGALLLLAVFLAADGLVGRAGAWLALALAVFDPNLLFHTRLVTTDLGVTLFFFVAVWQFWRRLAHGARSGLILAGVAGGLAMASKYTGVLLWPVLLLVLLLHPRDDAAPLSRRLLDWPAALAVALLTLWAVFRFDVGMTSQLPLNLPLPAPFYWDNLYRTFFSIVDGGDPKLFFLLGQRSLDGWWTYFPVALGVKTPLPTLLLIAAGVAAMFARRAARQQIAYWLPPLAFFALGLTGALTIGYRHMLPALPFLFVLAGNGAAWAVAQTGARRTVALGAQALAVACLVVGTARIYPHHGAYFNELAGPWTNWSTILVDSNLDWGQDLPALRTVMDDLGIDRVNLAYFGKAVPEQYGVRYTPLPGFLRFMGGKEPAAYNPYTPLPGWYAISATSLQLGLQQPESADLYAFFRDRTPDAQAGYSIYLYHITADDAQPVNRPVITGTPVWQLPADALAIPPGGRSVVKWRGDEWVTILPQGEGFTVPVDDAFTRLDANFSDVFTLVGATVRPAVEKVDITLFWRMGTQPMPMPAPTKGEPLSVFVHLVPAGGDNAVAQYDGWATALRGLEPGDIIVQPAAVTWDELPPGDYELRVGLYSPQDGARLGVGDGDFVVIGEIGRD